MVLTLQKIHIREKDKPIFTSTLKLLFSNAYRKSCQHPDQFPFNEKFSCISYYRYFLYITRKRNIILTYEAVPSYQLKSLACAYSLLAYYRSFSRSTSNPYNYIISAERRPPKDHT